MGGCESEMIRDYKLSADALVYVEGSSKGTQPKYFDRGYWYKVNRLGYEGKAEYLISEVLECSNVTDYVTYEECTINGRLGCRSKNFLKENESFMSFQRVYELYTGADLTNQIYRIADTSERIEFVKGFIKEHTGVDCTNYLSQILTLDMLVLNTDRHFHNLGLVVDPDSNSYRPAPIFDNGNSLLSDWDRFDEEILEENIDKVIGQPFAANLEYQAHVAGIGLKLDYQRLKKKLDKMNEQLKSRALNVLKYQINRYMKTIHNI